MKTCACAPRIGQQKKKNKDLGCAVLYLGVFPCMHRNIEGIQLVQARTYKRYLRQHIYSIYLMYYPRGNSHIMARGLVNLEKCGVN